MKCLIFSDSHGNSYYMQAALLLHPDAEVIFFLGDGLSDVDMLRVIYSDKMWIAVSGNCDFSRVFADNSVEKVEIIEILGHRIGATHGDIYRVKDGLENLKSFAESRSLDIVLFGHTHTPHEEYVVSEHPFYLFNPGSASGYHASFGILTLTEKDVLFSHGSL